MIPDALSLARLQTELARDLMLFAPELCVCGGVLAVLVARMVAPRRHAGPLAVVAAVAGLVVAVMIGVALTEQPGESPGGPAFDGLLRLDHFAAFLRVLILAAAVLVLLLGRLTGLPDREDAADFAALLLGGTLGMLLMVSADHLLMVFVAVEMASLPSYALAGFLKGRSKGSEAALKYVVYGAAASGVMLYGITLVAGRCGTGSLTAVTDVVARGGTDLPLAAGLMLLFVGFLFKLAAVPFHVWLPDVFDGAAAEVGAFLSVASKAAAVGLTVRVTLATGTEATMLALAGVAAVTATWGNLAALAQTNLKRMLAYSTVAHAGYMLMAVACRTPAAAAAVLYYLLAYLLMNVGAFAVVAVVRNRTGSEELSAVRGLVRRSPVVGVALFAFLLSLLGLPPLAGFAGKFQVFQSIYRTAADNPPLATAFYALLAVAVLNTVVSAGYYLAVLRAAGLDDPPADEKGNPLPLGESAAARAYLLGLAGLLVVAGVAWDPIVRYTSAAVAGF